MFFYVIFNIIISIIVIFVFHNIFNYFKNNLTAPKVKDLINKPKTGYDKINNVLGSIDSDIDTNISNNIDNNNDHVKSFDTNTIKDELKDFFKELNENNKNNKILNDYETLDNSNYIASF